MKKKWICCLCAAMYALAIGPAWAEEAPQLREPAGLTLSSATVSVEDMLTVSVYEGEVVAHMEALDFETDGKIGEVKAVVGQLVKAGDVLLTLDREAELKRCESLRKDIEARETDLRYDEALAEIDLDILNLELERLGSQLPRDEKAVTLKQLEIESFQLNAELEKELALLELDRLRAELKALEDESAKAQMIAPFDGRVMFIQELYSGTRVSAYEPLVYLADDSRVHLEVEYISETNLSRAFGMYALVDGERVEIEAQPADTAEILAKAVSGEALTTKFDVTSGQTLSPGAYAAVCVESGYVEDALVIPANALFAGAGGKYVYVVENGVRVRRDVKTAAVNVRHVQVLEGLEEGEEVYVPD